VKIKSQRCSCQAQKTTLIRLTMECSNVRRTELYYTSFVDLFPTLLKCFINFAKVQIR